MHLEVNMPMRGVRGATTVNEDQADQLIAATQELLEAILAANPGMCTEEIASVLFTVTHDLRSVFPALAARRVGWDSVPMICASEIPVPGSLPRCYPRAAALEHRRAPKRASAISICAKPSNSAQTWPRTLSKNYGTRNMGQAHIKSF